MLKILLLSLLLFTQGTHSSFTGVECFPDKGIIKTFLKMDFDDFVLDYRFTIDDDQNFDPLSKMDTSKIFISKYLHGRIQMFAGDKKLKGQITKLESTDGELIIGLLYYYDGRAKSLKVDNTFLAGLNKKPSNLLIFKCNDFEQGVRLTQEMTEYIFNIK